MKSGIFLRIGTKNKDLTEMTQGEINGYLIAWSKTALLKTIFKLAQLIEIVPEGVICKLE